LTSPLFSGTAGEVVVVLDVDVLLLCAKAGTVKAMATTPARTNILSFFIELLLVVEGFWAPRKSAGARDPAHPGGIGIPLSAQPPVSRYPPQ
jgi:hypothetical protein